MTDRIASLVAQLDGAIKYVDVLADHPEWTDEQVLAFARPLHEKAIGRLREILKHPFYAKLSADQARLAQPLVSSPWNEGIAHCRNVPTAKMIEEARRGR